MSTSFNSLADTVRKQAETIVAGGRDISRETADLVAGAAERFQQSGAGLVALARSVLEGAADAATRGTAHRPESALRQVIDGVGDGLSRAALATQLTFEEARSRQTRYAAEDVARARQDLQALNQLYLETLAGVLERARATASDERQRLMDHAAAVWERARPGLQSALEAAASHPAELGRETLQAGWEAGRHTAGALAQGMGRWLEEAGRRLRG